VAGALDVSESWVELKVWLEIFGEEKLYLHRVLGSVVQDDSLSVELLVNEDVQVVLLFLHIDGDIYALATD
jgi:hypothetical protein